MFIDTHAHLWWDSYSNDLMAVLDNAKQSKVEKMITPGTDIQSSQLAINLAILYPGRIYAAVGIHPEETTMSNFVFDINVLKQLISKNTSSIVAIGEIGIDLFNEDVKLTLDKQKEIFKSQLLLAHELNLPAIIHTRNSFAETWEVLTSLPHMPKGQFHCFSIDEESLKLALNAGFYISFGGNITWSKRVARLVPLVPNNRLLLETDSPLMVPRDTKGIPIGGETRNQPANIKYLAEVIAQLRKQSTSEIEEMTTSNANSLYKL